MNAKASILVVSASVTDADLVRNLLAGEFDRIAISTDPDRAVMDFEQYRPDVLVLAFKVFLNAERYYLGLYRLSEQIDSIRHRTLILCGRNDVKRVYELCRKGFYDDYILFWPEPHDALRLPMAIHHALSQMEASAEPGASEIAVQARQLQQLEKLLEKYADSSKQCADTAADTVRQAQTDILVALDRLHARLADKGSENPARINDQAVLQREIDTLKTDEIGKHFQPVDASIASMHEWAGSVRDEMAPQLESVRVLNALASHVRPMILVVDDDLFQHKLLAKMLEDFNAELVFAASGAEVLAVLRLHRPDLILMDIGLSDSDGIDLTRRIKAVERLASIPVIMITGQGEKSVVMHSMNAGADDFVVKPVDRNTLLAKLRYHLNMD